MATKIKVNANGSIRIEGDIELYDHNDNKYDLSGRTAISLCRCGASNNKPFCDGSHKACGFQSEVTAVVMPPPKK
jgi:CDGSH-type Zn-finger protein